MPDDPLYDTSAAAKYIGQQPSTLVWWRHVGRGPEYIKPEGRVHYRKSQLDKFLERGVVKPAGVEAA
jgi:hypothetical protein